MRALTPLALLSMLQKVSPPHCIKSIQVPLLMLYTKSHQRVSIISDSLSRPGRFLLKIRLSKVTLNCKVSLRGGISLTLVIPFGLFNILAKFLPVNRLIVISHWDQETLWKATCKLKYDKLIFDTFDPLYRSLSPLLEKHCLDATRAEYSFLSNADLLLARDLRLAKILSVEPELRLAQTLFYPEYISHSALVTPSAPLSLSHDTPIEFVYIGNLDLDSGSSSNFIHSLLPILSSSNCQLYVYCSYPSVYRLLRKLYSDFVDRGTLHPRKSVSHADLRNAISRHHVGINLTKPDQSLHHATYNEASFRASLGSKVFNYVAAGLPSICEKDTFCGYVVERYLIGCTIASLEELIPAARYCLSESANLFSKDLSKLSLRAKRGRLERAIYGL